MNVTVKLDRLYEDDYETSFFLRSYVEDSKLPRTVQMLDLVLRILACLTPQEATALLDRTRSYSSCLIKRSVWSEALLQSCIPDPSDCLSSANAGTFAQASGEDGYEFTTQPADVAGNSLTTIPQPCIENLGITVSLTTSRPGPFDVENDWVVWGTDPTSSHILPQDICYSTKKYTSLSGPCAIETQQAELYCGPFTSVLLIPQNDCPLKNNTIQSKLGKRQSPEGEIKHCSSLSVDTLGIPAHKRRCTSFASVDAKPVLPVEELGVAGDIPNALEKDPILPANKESSTFCQAAHMPQLDQSIINAGNGRLILDNFPEFLAVNSASWSLKEAQGQHSLGIPLTKFMSYQSACVAYLKAWEAQPDANRQQQSSLSRFYRRVMQICFFAFFQGLVQEVNEKDAAGTLSDSRRYRRNCTIARDLIIQETYGDNITKTQKGKYRQTISDSILRYGSRWWKMASCIGLGSVLFASEELAITMAKTNFTEDMVEELIIYMVNVYPGLVSLCQEFGPITQSLMLGKGFSSLFEKINESTFLDRLTNAEQRVQDPPDPWKTVNLKLFSTSAANDFLRFRQEYFQESEAAGGYA